MTAGRWAIACEGIVIGWSSLETLGTPRGIVRGRFEPTPEFERVRALFRAESLWHALAEDEHGERLVAAAERARSALRFELIDDAGARLAAPHLYVSEPTAPDAGHEVIALLGAPAARRVARRTAGSTVPMAVLHVAWLDDDGCVAESLPAPPIGTRLLHFAPRDGACLRFVDPAGRTVFNRWQLPVLVRELELARAAAPPAVRESIDRLLRFLAPRPGPTRRYVAIEATGGRA